MMSERSFDLVIVGGGVYGICAAREAALQGLSVCLVERDDFGGKTSANSLKIMHGGLRYLQNLDFKRMRESIGERRVLHALAPHLVRPMAFVIPCYGHLLRGREVMAGALAMNALVSADRNRGVMRERHLPAGSLLSKRRLEQMIPELPEAGCVGGAVWYDGQAQNTERLMLAFLEHAREAGAVTRNHCEVVGFIEQGQAVAGVRLADGSEIRSRVVLNAAGPWVDRLLTRLELATPARHFHMSKGMNLVTRKIFDDYAAAIPYQESYDDKQAVFDKGKLHFFICPWKQYSLIGTRHLPWDGEPDAFRVERADVQQFLDEINRAYPRARLTLADVKRVYEGMLPALAGDGDVQIGKQYTITDHADSDGVEGLVTLLGVKWTTARDVSQRAVGTVLNKLGKRPRVDSAGASLPSGRFESWDALLARLDRIADGRYDAALLERLAESHGAGAPELLERAVADTTAGRVIEGEGASPTLAVEILHAVEHEQASTLDDVLLRRTELAIGGHPGESTVREVAELIGCDDRQLESFERTMGRLLQATRPAA